VMTILENGTGYSKDKPTVVQRYRSQGFTQRKSAWNQGQGTVVASAPKLQQL